VAAKPMAAEAAASLPRPGRTVPMAFRLRQPIAEVQPGPSQQIRVMLVLSADEGRLVISPGLCEVRGEIAHAQTNHANQGRVAGSQRGLQSVAHELRPLRLGNKRNPGAIHLQPGL